MAKTVYHGIRFFFKESKFISVFFLGLTVGVAVFTQIFETNTVTRKETQEGSREVSRALCKETKSESASRLNCSNTCKADTRAQNLNPVRFPYNEYTRFGLEWTGIVDELEWSSESLHPTGNDNAKPFSIRVGSAGLTSTKKSRVYLYEGKAKYEIGDFVHVVIEGLDKYGGKRRKGGDFFEPVMFNEKLQKSTAGRVVDYGNGTYSVYFYAAWQGTRHSADRPQIYRILAD